MSSLDALIVTKLDAIVDKGEYEIVRINDDYVKDGEIFCFIANRDIPLKTSLNVCFIPYNRKLDWDYKNNARSIAYKLSDENCVIVDTDVTYQIHKEINLPHDEEVDIALLATHLILNNGGTVVLSHRPNLSERQSLHLEQLITDKKIKVLYE